MTITADRVAQYADLGEAWVLQQLARIHQRHLQCGRHFRLDMDALLANAARFARGSAGNAVRTRRQDNGDHLRRATVEAVEYCARLRAVE
jgi:hypothetical protein